MPAPIAAAIRGGDYQALLGWQMVLLLLDPDDAVERVGIEDATAHPADDIVVVRARRAEKASEFWQVKYHVSQAGAYTAASLIRRANRAPSLLGGLWKVWVDRRARHRHIVVGLLSNWGLASNDPLCHYLRDEYYLSQDIIRRPAAAARQWMSRWKLHLGCDERALGRFLTSLRLRLSEPSLARVEELTKWRMGSLGLRADRGAVLIGTQIVKMWMSHGPGYVTREILEEALDRERLRAVGPGRAMRKDLSRVVRDRLESVRSSSAAVRDRALSARRSTSVGEKRASALERKLVRLLARDRPRDVIVAVRSQASALRHRPATRLRYIVAAHLGLALRRMGRAREALLQLKRAATIQPTRAQALANVALAYLDTGQDPPARRWALRALRRDPRNSLGLWVITSVFLRQERTPEAAQTARRITDEQLRTDAYVAVARNRTGRAGAIRLLAKGLRQRRAPERLLHFARTLAEIDPTATDPRAFVPWVSADSTRRREVLYALRLVREAEALLRRRRSQDSLAECLILKAILIAYTSGKRSDSEIHEAAALAPDNPTVVRRVAQYWLEHGDGHNALAMLAIAGRNRSLIEGWERLQARAMLFAEQYDKVFAFCSRSDVVRGIGETEAAALRAAALFEQQRYRESLVEITNIPDGDANPQLAITRARATFRLGASDRAFAILRGAQERVPVRDKWRIIFVQAGFLSELGRWPEAVELYAGLYGPAAIPEVIAQYLVALYNADRLGTCVRVGREVLLAQGVRPQFSVVLRALIELGYLDEAENSCRRLVKEGAGDPSAKLMLVEILVRRGQLRRAERVLPAASDAARLDLTIAERAAELSLLVGRTKTALDIAFLAVQRRPRDRDAQWLLVKIVWNTEGLDRDVLRPTEVGPGTRVKLSDGVTHAWRNLLPYDARTRNAEDLLPDSTEAQRLTGRALNAAAGVRPAWATRVVHIAEIESLYQAVAQEFVREMAADPNQRHRVEAVPIGAETVARMQSSAQELARMRDELRALYERELPPLGALARLPHQHSGDVWYGLISGELGARIEVARLVPPEEEDLVQAATRANECVLETTAILALAEWGVLDRLSEGPWRWLVTLSALADLEEMTLERRAATTRQSGSVTWESGGLAVRIITRAQARKAYAMFSNTLHWLRANAECVPVPIEAADGRHGVGKRIGRAALDALLIARDRAALLVTEDRGLREIARTKGGVTGSMALSLVEVMARQGLLEPALAHRIRAIAAGWGYTAIAIKSETFAAALAADGGRCGGVLRAVINRLGGPELDSERAAALAIDGIDALRGADAEVKSAVMAEMRGAIRARHRGEELWRRVELQLSERGRGAADVVGGPSSRGSA